LAETGIEGISFSGGEPTIVPRFDEICAYVKAKGMKIFVNTNGIQFKKAGGTIFIEIYKEDLKTVYRVPLEKFISNVDQFCFSLDTIDPNSFRGEAPLLWPEVITTIKTICGQKNKDIEIVITTTITKENIDKIKTDLLPYVESIILDAFNKTKQLYPTIRLPMWKFNIFQPLKNFSDETKRSLGITHDEFSRLHNESVQLMRERMRVHLAREHSSLTVDQVLRMNRTVQEQKTYKYLMILPNGVLVTTVDDGALSYGLHERGFEVIGYLDKTDPWIYKDLSEAIANGINEKFSNLGVEYAPVVKVINGSNKRV
jgi:organic radical activating enzyme